MHRTQAPRIALVAGEASGDLLGSRLIDALRKLYPNAEFFGIGGPKMQSAGLDSWFDQERLAVRGLLEVLRHLPALFSIRAELLKRIVDARPHLFIGIDAPDFNLGLEKRLKRRGIRTAHVVSPTVWAWRRGRIKTIRAAVSHMLVLLPFEEAIYKEEGIPVTFIGHPLADEIPDNIDREAMIEHLRLPADAPIVTILPGSRQSEVEQMAGPLIEAAKLIHMRSPQTRFLVPLITRETRDLFETILYTLGAQDLPLQMLFGHAHDALSASHVALATSGTVTLEAALLRCPMVIAYRVTPASYAIAKRVIRVEHIGLPNILSGRWVVPEFIQDEMTPENLAQACLNLLQDEPVRKSIALHFDEVHRNMRRNAADSAAGALRPLIEAAV
ncbi:MAG TPA: lipid-A-disaccharide synthase [Burkholderiales bacterium]|nr:lipid-A-disaccharide synthase [Burkholderiales bacterium]